MRRTLMIAVVPLGLAVSCTQTATTPGIPEGGPLSGAEIRSLVDGGPYELRIFDGDLAGTVGRSTWDFGAATVSGTFTTAGGETGTFSQPIALEGNRLCAGNGETRNCHFVYRYEDGFMEVTEAGAVHAISTPL